ncbi:hypothetical protein [Streptomyces kaempferi]|uniref:MarR family transcriptional regulator n=1 Tax=Streptomyces kaempferi TaxID=333725 RepID=A0ABW3XMF1_9ACTN
MARVRAAGIDEALTAVLGSDEAHRLREVTEALDVLARNLLSPSRTPGPRRGVTVPPPE